nr:serine hydrolase [Kordiimonas marina]
MAAVSLSGPRGANAETPNLDDHAALETFVDGVVRAQLEALDIPGATVSIVKDGKVILEKGYGYARVAEGAHVRPDSTLFRIGSTSKLFTWTAVMQLYEEGKLDLDANVNKYLKTFQIPDTFDRPITMRDILSHSAGFEDGGLGYLIAAGQDQVMPLRKAMAKYMPERILPPGKLSAYSNYGAALAGLIVENISGMPFDDYVAAHIYKPLGMTHSTFVEPILAPLSADVASGYAREEGVFKAQGFEYISSFAPAGSMSSTADDMAKFMLAHLQDGAGILKPETAKLMHSRLFGVDKRLPGMAYGFYQEDENGFRLIGHGGDTDNFHTNLVLDFTHNLGIFISFNKVDGRQARSQFVREFYDYYFPVKEAPLKAPADFSARAGSYVGSYFMWRSNFSTIEKVLGLLSQVKVSATDDNHLLVSGLGRDRQFVEVDHNLFHEVGGKFRLFFETDGTGKAVTLHMANYPFLTWGRSPFYYSASFNFPWLGLSLFLLVTVLLAAIYKRRVYKAEPVFERRAIRVSTATSVLHLLFWLLAGLMMAVDGSHISARLPVYLGYLLTVPILASLSSLLQAFVAVRVWRSREWGVRRKLHYTLVTASALFLVWFYYFWNILGYQYF